MLQRQKAKGQPSELRERSRRLSASLEGTQLGSGSSAASSVGKRRNAAGAPVAPPRALPQSFLTRKGSEFGVVRPQQQIKITSRYTICEKLGEGNTATVRRCIDKVRGAWCVCILTQLVFRFRPTDI